VQKRYVAALLKMLMLACAGNCSAGAANIELACKATNSGGSGITLKGSIPGDMDEFELNLANRNGALNWTQDSGDAHTVVALDRKVFVLVLALKDGSSLKMYAIPASVNHKGDTSRMFGASFDAMLEHAPRPGYVSGKGLDAYVRNVPLRCTASHSI
jgi:hypothetical protein